MPESQLIPIGGYAEGIDNVHAADDRVFDVVSTNEGINPPRRCVTSTNLEFNDEGLPQLRPGSIQRIAATAGLGAIGALGMLFYQDQGVIKRVTGTAPYATVDVITGLNSTAPIIFHEHAGEIFWTNGLVNGRIKADGTAGVWGLTIPPAPTLGTTAGDLPAGRYLVVCVLEDSDQIEHATGAASLVTLDGTTDITVDLSAVDSDAATVRIFSTKANGEKLYYVASVAPGSLPATITDVQVSRELPRTQFLSPPIPGDGMFSFRGTLITFNGEYLYPSVGVNAHIFDTEETEESRIDDIKAAAGLDDGFWVVTDSGAFWTTGGGDPASWDTKRKDNRQYATGSLVVPGSYIGGLGVSDNVALFVSNEGLMIGRPDGVMEPFSGDKIRLDVDGKSASIVYYKAGDYNQFIYTLN